MSVRFSVVESAASSGLATVSSSTPGSTPWLLTPTRTCGYTMRGRRSSGSRWMNMPPSTRITEVSMSVPTGRRIDQLAMPRRCALVVTDGVPSGVFNGCAMCSVLSRSELALRGIGWRCGRVPALHHAHGGAVAQHRAARHDDGVAHREPIGDLDAPFVAHPSLDGPEVRLSVAYHVDHGATGVLAHRGAG